MVGSAEEEVEEAGAVVKVVGEVDLVVVEAEDQAEAAVAAAVVGMELQVTTAHDSEVNLSLFHIDCAINVQGGHVFFVSGILKIKHSAYEYVSVPILVGIFQSTATTNVGIVRRCMASQQRRR